MYYLLGICLALAALLTLNALLTVAAAALWFGAKRCASAWTAATRARILFAFRILPPIGALALTAVFLVPAYIAHEPYPKTEVAGSKLILLALISASGIAFALSRLVGSWLATRRISRDWLRSADLVNIKGVDIPAYRFRHSFPVIAVVGTLRPRLFVAGQIFDSLNDEEMAAAVAHERGHLVARDTLKRIVMRACRDLLLFVPAGRRFDRAWAEESERAADEYAARDGATVALDLAAVLIKVARFVPRGGKPAVPAGAFLIEATDSGVASRVRRLTELAAAANQKTRRGATLPHSPLWAGIAALLAVVTLTIINPEALATTHVFIEHVVWILG